MSIAIWNSNKVHVTTGAYISEEYGEYNAGTSIIAFDANDLTEEQWYNIENNLTGSDRYWYAVACLQGKTELAEQFEREF